MRRFSIVIALALSCLTASAQSLDPVADPQAVVVSGNARFTVLTDRLVRMEWNENGTFEDNATLAIVNRRLPVPAFTASRKGDRLVISTKSLVLEYVGNAKFDENNIRVSFRLNGKKVVWHPGLSDKANLLGTARTLDGCNGFEQVNSNDPMELGILSRDGWAIVDESSRHLLVKDDSDWGHWVSSRPEEDLQDLYIFAYGHDYKAALADFTKVAGKIPLPPKYVFGYWWSRYWAYSADEFLSLAREFRTRKIPIDIMIIDMDWHETWPKSKGRDVFGQRIGWTGYSWNRDLFPDPAGLLGELHDMGFRTALNLHPASGIVPREVAYEDFVKDYTSRCSDYDGPQGFIYKGGETMPNGEIAKKGYRAAVPFRIDQKEWTDAYFNSVLHPIERQGVDFWWLDWQQWKTSKYTEGLSNTFWLNYTFFNDKVRRTAGQAPEDSPRALIYHRWGGLGSHRYQLGFSGDTYIKWSVLQFLPYFTATASNVGYGYWGHDLGGHMQKEKIPTDPELFTRWLQYGVFSPLFKTHSTNSSILERRIWTFEEHYPYMLEAFNLRYALTPYIYDMARKTYDSGVSLCRPMYYDYPEENAAYDYREQYMFGDNILAATVCEPADSLTGVAGRKVWFPAGNDWYDMAHRKMLKGGTVQTLKYTIAENCWFVRAGAIIPMAAEGIQSLQDRSNELRIYIAPGKGKSSYTHYEDDEVSEAYATDYATTVISKESSDASCKIMIGARNGSYKDMPATRRLSIVLGGLAHSPRQAKTGSAILDCSYDATKKEATVFLPESDASQAVTVTVIY